MEVVRCERCHGMCFNKGGYYQCAACKATVNSSGKLVKVSKNGKVKNVDGSAKSVASVKSTQPSMGVYSSFQSYSGIKKASSDKIEEEQNKLKVSKSAYAYVFVAIIYILAMYNKVSPVALIEWLDEIVMNFAEVYFSRLAEILCYVYIFQAMVAFFAERMHGKDISYEGGALKSLFENSTFQGIVKVVLCAGFMTVFFFAMPTIDEWLVAKLGLQIADLMIFVMMAVPAVIMLGIKLLQILVYFGDTFKFILSVIVMSLNLLAIQIYILIAHNVNVNASWLGTKCYELACVVCPDLSIPAILLFLYYTSYVVIMVMASINQGMAVIKNAGEVWETNFENSVFGGIGRIVISILLAVALAVAGSWLIDLLSGSISQEASSFLIYLGIASPAYLLLWVKAWQLKVKIFDRM